MALGFTYDILRIRVAEYLGVSFKGTDGTEKPQLPQGEFDLDIVSRMVNDGYRRFITDFNWEFMTPLDRITFVSRTTGSITTAGTGTFTDTARTETTGTFNGQNIKITREDGSLFVTTVLTSTSSGVFTFADETLVFLTTDEYTISTAVDGESHRYLMPDDYIGILVRDLTYELPQGSPLLTLAQVSEDKIRAFRAGGTTTTGDPVMVAFRPITVDDRPRWEAIFWPTPGTIRTVAFRYRRFPQELEIGTEVTIAGPQHDMTLLQACRAEAERQRFDRVAIEESRYQSQLEVSKRLDRESRPKSLGIEGLNVEGPGVFTPNGLVDFVNGTEITF